MIAVFLRAEIASVRFKDYIITQLERDHKGRSVIDTPDLNNSSENWYRRQVLASYRAYVFEELPAHIVWYRALLSPEEVMKIRYVSYDYWNEISDNSRLATVAAETIRAGHEIYGESNQGFWDAANALRLGARFPELIIAGVSPGAELTIYEGHVRLTAYLLAPECIPSELEVIAGFAPECARI